MKNRLFSLFIFTLVFCCNTTAQNPYIRHFTSNNGLPSNTIYQIFQDSHKFIWFTSDAGVVKFDGSNYTSFRKKDGLTSNDVVRIKEDTKGRIWIFNYNGTVNYIYNNKVYNGNNTPFLKSIIGKGFILDFFIDTKQTIHFYNWQREVFSLDTNNKVVKIVLLTNLDKQLAFDENDFSNIKISHLSLNISNEWVIWSNLGIFNQNILQNNKICVIDSGLYCRSVYTGINSNYFVKTSNNQIIKVNSDFRKEKFHFSGDILKVQTILEDKEGYIWIAAYDEGVYCIKNNIIVKRFRIKEALGLFQDHEKNIWVSTQSEGIFVLDHDILEQNHFDASYFDNLGLNLLYDYPGTGIWCSNSKSAFLLKNNEFYKLIVPEAIQPVNIIYMFKKPALLIGSTNSRFCTFESLQFNAVSKNIEYRQKLTYNRFTKKIVTDLTGKTITLFDQNKIFNTNKNNPSFGSFHTAINERINNVYYNIKNELVINAKRNYLFINNKLEPYPKLSRFDGTIISDHLVLNDSTELFNIDGDSLFLLQNQQFYNLTDAFDIPVEKQIKSVYYKNATLYIVTLSDIYVCYNPSKIVYSSQISLEPMNLSFNNIKDFLIHNDTIYVASEDGLTVIPEAAIAGNQAIPPISYLQSITVNNKVLILTANELKLSGKNYIKLSFSCISYSSSPVSYAYILEGADNKWTMGTGSNINLMYQNLPKGNYIFKLRVRKSNSAWSDPLLLTIIIKPTFAEYPAFWIFIALMAAGLIFLITFRMRVQKIKKAEMDHQLIVMEQKALQSMMNPHFIFNSLGSIQNYLLKNKGSEAVIYLSQFARLIRQNLNAINAPMIPLDEEIDRLRNYMDLENKRLENKFDYNIEIDERLEEDRLYIPSMIIQPIVENAIWHGLATLEEAGSIKISFRAHTNRSLKVIVEDNGIGLKKSLEYSAKSSQHQHLGMQIIKKRLILLSKKYHTELGINYSENYPGLNSPGAVVEIILPFVFNNNDF